MVMDYDDFSKDDFIGATQIKLYEVLSSSSSEICINRLLDNIVSHLRKLDIIIVIRSTIGLTIFLNGGPKYLSLFQKL